jgi:hypothetical protein
MHDQIHDLNHTLGITLDDRFDAWIHDKIEGLSLQTSIGPDLNGMFALESNKRDSSWWEVQ